MRVLLYIGFVIAATLSINPAFAESTGQVTSPESGGELSNPDDTTVLYLYYHMAGLSVPVESWVEDDGRVSSAPGAEKAAARKRVREAIHAAARSVDNIARIRLRMNADLSEYDPDYKEFTIGALSPSSSVVFRSHGQTIRLQFSNSQKAQVWSISQEKAQSVLDKLSDSSYERSGVVISVLAKLLRARPLPDGGVIVAKILSYELRDPRSGTVIKRVTVSQ